MIVIRIMPAITKANKIKIRTKTRINMTEVDTINTMVADAMETMMMVIDVMAIAMIVAAVDAEVKIS